MDNQKKIAGSALGALLLTAVFVVPVLAKRPLYGEMTLDFNLGWFLFGPQDGVPDWVGTIEIDGETYGMLFFAIGSGKPFDVDPPGKVHFFGEIWAIYETSDFPALPDEIPLPGEKDGIEQAWAQWLDTAPVVMWGYDRGITNKQNAKYHMTGNVEAANANTDPEYDFTMLEGRQVYMNGIIIWDGGLPSEAPGIFRIN